VRREEEGSSSNRTELAAFSLALRDTLIAAIMILRKRIVSGTATFLVKVKVHRGEPANEGADILADKAISDPKVGKEWCQLKN